jgi:hypothetical protein
MATQLRFGERLPTSEIRRGETAYCHVCRDSPRSTL